MTRRGSVPCRIAPFSASGTTLRRHELSVEDTRNLTRLVSEDQRYRDKRLARAVRSLTLLYLPFWDDVSFPFGRDKGWV